MKLSGILYYLPVDMFPTLGNTPTSKVLISNTDTVSGEIHILNSDRKKVIADLRKLVEELEKIDHSKTT